MSTDSENGIVFVLKWKVTLLKRRENAAVPHTSVHVHVVLILWSILITMFLYMYMYMYMYMYIHM